MTFVEIVIQIDDRLKCDRIEVDTIIVKVLSFVLLLVGSEYILPQIKP